jgi:hypothetical protein
MLYCNVQYNYNPAKKRLSRSFSIGSPGWRQDACVRNPDGAPDFSALTLPERVHGLYSAMVDEGGIERETVQRRKALERDRRTILFGPASFVEKEPAHFNLHVQFLNVDTLIPNVRGIHLKEQSLPVVSSQKHIFAKPLLYTKFGMASTEASAAIVFGAFRVQKQSGAGKCQTKG